MKRAQISEMRPITANTRPTFAGSTTPHEIFCMVSQATPPTRIEMMLQKISFDFSVFMMPTFLMKKLSFLKYRGKENICILSVCRNVYIRTEELTIPISERVIHLGGFVSRKTVPAPPRTLSGTR